MNVFHACGRYRPWLLGLAIAVGAMSLSAHSARADTPAAAPSTQPATQPAAAATSSTPADPTPDPTGTLGGATSPLTTPNAYLAGQPDASVPVGGSFKPYAGDAPTAKEAYNLALNTTFHLNFVRTLVARFLAMFMQAGVALVETGLCRAKNAAHPMTMNFLVYPLGMLSFWACGFGLMCGGANYSGVGGPGGLGGMPAMNQGFVTGASVAGGHGWLLFGTKGFFLTGGAYDGAVIVWFLFMMVFMDTTAT